MFTQMLALYDPGQRKKNGAGNEVRTRDLNLGKVALYQLSYSRAELNAWIFYCTNQFRGNSDLNNSFHQPDLQVTRTGE